MLGNSQTLNKTLKPQTQPTSIQEWMYLYETSSPRPVTYRFGIPKTWSTYNSLIHVKEMYDARELSNPEQNPKNPKTRATSIQESTYLIETLSPQPVTYRFGIPKAWST
jgi:hypothetical protein